MENIDIINRLSKKSDELNQIIDHIKENGDDSQLYIDLCLNKLREMYELLIIKTKEINNIENNITEPNIEIKKEDIDNTKPQTEFDNELENLNFYSNSENNDFSEIPITDSNDENNLFTQKNDINKETVKQEETPIQENKITSEAEKQAEIPIQKNEVINKTEKQAEIPIQKNEVINKTKKQAEIPIQENEINNEADNSINEPATPQPTLFDNKGEKQNTIIESETKEIINDINSTQETIGEKLLETNKKTINDILADIRTERDLATQMQYQSISDLKSVISLNDKIRFIKELFNSDNEQYNRIIDSINNCTDLDQAMIIINENIIWDENKPSFKEFLEFVYRRHLPETK